MGWRNAILLARPSRNLTFPTLTACAWPGGQWNRAMDAKRPKSLGLRTSSSAVARESIEDTIGLIPELLRLAARCACSGGASMVASRLLLKVARHHAERRLDLQGFLKGPLDCLLLHQISRQAQQI